MIDLGDFSIVILDLADAESLNAMLLKNTERFQRYFPKTLKQNLNLEMTKEYILKKKSLFDAGEEYTMGIKDIASKNIVGLVILKNINRKIADAEVAYCLDADFGGKGLMTKSVNKICEFAKEKADLKSLFIIAHKTNISSVRVAEKTGFIWSETEFKSYTPVNETEPIDMEKFVITL
ncbi:MAG: GNAT family N-acetyltransferase [Flavobacteriaceae bacterium]